MDVKEDIKDIKVNVVLKTPNKRKKSQITSEFNKRPKSEIICIYIESESEEEVKSKQNKKKNSPKKKKDKKSKLKKAVKDENVSESESEEEVEEQKKVIGELRQFFQDNDIQLKPGAPTRGDGNCFFRAVADQIRLHKIPDKPTTHRDLRLAVCNHLKDLPKDVLQRTVDIIYKGKRRGLTDLACRQRKLGQFVDDNGIMVMSTAIFLARNIEVYSAHAGNQGHSVTKIEGGEGADHHPSLTIFYFKDLQHYQAVERTNTD